MNKTEAWTFVTILFLLTIIIYLKSWIRAVYLALRLPGPKALPFIGNALLITDSKKIFYIGKHCSQIYGRIFRIWISVIPLVFVVEPNDIQAIIGNNKNNDKNFIYSLMHNFVGQGLITNNGHNWKVHRKLIQPYFHMNILQNHINSFSNCAHFHLNKLNISGDINITSFANECILDILHDAVLGISLEETKIKENSPYRRGQITLPIRIQKPWYLIQSLYEMTSLAEFELKQKNKLQDYTRMVLEQYRMGLLNMKKEHKSLLEAFIEISENNKDFTDDDIVNEACTFMLAGQDSVSTAVAFALYHLAKHEDIQQKVLQELSDIFGTSNRSANADDINKMKYLEQCVKETVRLCPSIPVFGRKLSEDVNLGNYTIPKGCNVFISPFATHHLAHIYKDPEDYNPDRFSVENFEKLHPFAFMSFSAGPRNCIGFKFALMEVKTVLSTFLRTYRISLCPGRDFTLLYRLTLRAKGGIWLKVRQR